MTEPHEITLRPTGRAAFVFTGTLRFKVEADEEHRKLRRHAIAVYNDEHGNWIGEIRYFTEWRGEPDHCTVFICETPGKLGGYLRKSYAPDEQVEGYPPGAAYADRQRRLKNAVRLQYESLLTELLGREVFRQEIPTIRDLQCLLKLEGVDYKLDADNCFTILESAFSILTEVQTGMPTSELHLLGRKLEALDAEQLQLLWRGLDQVRSSPQLAKGGVEPLLESLQLDLIHTMT